MLSSWNKYCLIDPGPSFGRSLSLPGTPTLERIKRDYLEAFDRYKKLQGKTVLDEDVYYASEGDPARENRKPPVCSYFLDQLFCGVDAQQPAAAATVAFHPCLYTSEWHHMKRLIIHASRGS